jgi:hypothetical protein
MFSYDDTITRLRRFFLAEALAVKAREDFYNAAVGSDEYALLDSYNKNYEIAQRSIRKTCEDLVTFPPHLVRHQPKIGLVNTPATPYEKSVFIMTKYPDMKGAKWAGLNAELDKVIGAVEAAVSGRNYMPRKAIDHGIQAMLWDNVELFLVGCKWGIAIVESKYRKELNPNVTMEWGWMRGMGREVLYLKEKSFNKERADLSGLRVSEFDWDDPVPGIVAGVANFLPKLP